MPIERCEKCDKRIDIEANPEAYREELSDQLICDMCMDSITTTEDEPVLKTENGLCGNHECECDFKAYQEATCYEDYLIQSAKRQKECDRNKRVSGPTEPPRPLGHYPVA